MTTDSDFQDSPIGLIPEDWSVAKIEEIVLPEKGAIKIGPFGSQLPKSEMVAKGIKVYGQQNVIENDFGFGDKYISFEKYRTLKSVEVFPGDILLSMMGTIGYARQLPKDAEKGIMDSHLLRIQLNQEMVLSDFLIFLMQSEIVKSQIRQLSRGAIMSGLNSEIVRSIQVPIPSVPEQHHVTRILDMLDLTITQTEQLITKLRAIKSGLLHDLLTRGIGEDGCVRDPEKQPEEFKESEVGLIPRSWSVVRIADLTEINGATLTSSADPNYEIEYLDISSIEHLEEVSSTTTMKFISAPSRARRIVRSGDTIVSTVRPYLRAIAFIKNAPKNLVASTGFAVLTPNNQVIPLFLYQITISEPFICHLIRRMTGSNYPAVIASDVGDYSFPLPSTEEQEKISEILSRCDLRISFEEAYLKKMRFMKKGLMQDLLTGRVRVNLPKDNNGEG